MHIIFVHLSEVFVEIGRGVLAPEDFIRVFVCSWSFVQEYGEAVQSDDVSLLDPASTIAGSQLFSSDDVFPVLLGEVGQVGDP